MLAVKPHVYEALSPYESISPCISLLNVCRFVDRIERDDFHLELTLARD